jgi:hypothetical protein
MATQLDAVASANTVRSRMGHGSLAVTSIYARPVEEADRAAARYMGDLLDGRASWHAPQAFAMGNLSEAGESLSILLVNLAGLLTGGVLTLLGTRVGATDRGGQAIFRPKPRPGP